MTRLFKNMTMKEYQKTGKKPYTFLNFLIGFVIPGLVFACASVDSIEMPLAITIMAISFVGNIALLALTSKNVGFTIKWTLLGLLISTWVFIRTILVPLVMISVKFIGLSTGSGYDANGQVNYGTSVFSIMSYKGLEIQSDVVTGGGEPQYVGGYNELKEKEGAKVLGYDTAEQAKAANPAMTNEQLQNVYEQRNDEQKTADNINRFGK